MYNRLICQTVILFEGGGGVFVYQDYLIQAPMETVLLVLNLHLVLTSWIRFVQEWSEHRKDSGPRGP